MKKVLGYISVVLLAMSIVSCEDNSLQKKLDDEKDIRVEFVEGMNDASDPDFVMTTTGLYYRIVKANNENVENYDKEKTISDTLRAGYTNFNLKVFWNFYIHDEDNDKVPGVWSGQLGVAGAYTNGDYEPYQIKYDPQLMKNGLVEAFSVMKKGDYAEFVIPSTLLTVGYYAQTGQPYLGIEGMYRSVYCQVRLLDIDIKEDPNLD